MDVVCSTCYRNRDSFTSEIAGLGKERVEYFAEMFVYLDGRIYRSMGTLPDRRYAYNGKAVDFVCTAVVSSGRRLAESEIFLGNGRLCSRTYIFDRLDFVQKQILSGGNYSLADIQGIACFFSGKKWGVRGKPKQYAMLLYPAVLMGMTVLALSLPFRLGKEYGWIALGAGLFAVSDMMVGKSFFHEQTKGIHYLALGLYYSGIYCFALMMWM